MSLTLYKNTYIKKLLISEILKILAEIGEILQNIGIYDYE